MADVRISQLDALRDVADDDILIVNDKSDGNKTKVTRKKDLLFGLSKNITDDGPNAVVNQDLIVNNDISLDGDIKTTGSITFGMLTDHVNQTSVLGFIDDPQDIYTHDSVIPTSKAIRDYVNGTLISMNSVDSSMIVNQINIAFDSFNTLFQQTDSGVIVLGERITNIESHLNSIDSDYILNATSAAREDLRALILLNDSGILVLSERITSLQSSLTDGGDSVSSTAIEALSSRINQDSDRLTIESLKIVNLQSSLETIDSDLGVRIDANAAASSELITRINQDSDSLVALSEDVSALTVSLEDLRDSVSANGNAIDLLRTRIDQDSDGLAIISSKVTNLEASLTEGIDSDLVIQVLGNAVEELETRIDLDSDRLTVESQKIVNLEANYSNLVDSVSANGTAFNELKTRVDADSDKLSVVSSEITNLSASVNDPTTGLSANASAVSALTATVDNLGNASAVYALDLDVNGHIAGIKLENTGDSSEFIVNADAFRVYNGSTDSTAFSVVDGQVYLDGINVLGANIEDLTVQNLEGDVNVITSFNGSAYKTWGPTSAGYVTLTEVVLPANSTGINHVASIMMTYSGKFASDTVKTKLESKVDGGTYTEIQTMSQVTGSGGQASETVTVIGAHPSETNQDVHFRISVEMRGNNGTDSTSQSRSSTNVWSGVLMGTVGGFTLNSSNSNSGGGGTGGGGTGDEGTGDGGYNDGIGQN